MNPVRVIILGCRAPYPGSDNLPSVVISWNRNQVLLDAGEGVQSKLLRVGISPTTIKYVLVTHLHGDHILGLMPLLQSRSLANVKEEIVIVGPKGIKKYVEVSSSLLNFKPSYNVEFVEFESRNSQYILKIGNSIDVYAYPLKHSVYTIGYTLILKDKVKISYVTDTRPLYEYSLIPSIMHESDLLIHDSTFSYLDAELAQNHYHSTELEAAQTANIVKAKLLLLYHISPRYKDPSFLVSNARRLFQYTYAAKKFMRVLLKS